MPNHLIFFFSIHSNSSCRPDACRNTALVLLLLASPVAPPARMDDQDVGFPDRDRGDFEHGRDDDRLVVHVL